MRCQYSYAWIIFLISVTSGYKTCWNQPKSLRKNSKNSKSQFCINVFSVRFFNEDPDSTNLEYAGTTPSINLQNSLPKIQLVGDFSEVSKNLMKDLKVALSHEPGEFSSKTEPVLAFDEDHGVSISPGYDIDNQTKTFNLNDHDLKSRLKPSEKEKILQIAICYEKNCKFVSEEAAIKIYLPGGLSTTQQYIVLGILLCFSGLFSGLNLGLMALEPTELQAAMNVEETREDASVVYPVRKTGNFLLCVLLLGNTLVNTTLSVLTGDLFTGLVAVIGSTFGIVIFGEIIPQSLCSRHGLKIGAKTIWITKLFMVITAPIAWPIAKILDFVQNVDKSQILIFSFKSFLVFPTFFHLVKKWEAVCTKLNFEKC